MKTIKLSDSPRTERPERVSDILSAAVVIAVLLFGRAALNGAHTEAQPIMVITPKPAIAIVIATAAPTQTPAPTATPAPTSEPVYITLPTPEPQVIYVESPPTAPQEAPSAPEAMPRVVEDVPTLAPQQLVILDRGAWAVMAATARAGR